jgi:hypothetical protein
MGAEGGKMEMSKRIDRHDFKGIIYVSLLHLLLQIVKEDFFI